VRKILFMFAFPVALAGVASSASAATANGVLTVQASVVATCAVASGTLAFGVIDPAAGTSNLVSTNLAVNCTQGTSFSVGLGDSGNVAAGQRRMRGATGLQYLAYDLFRDSAGQQRFGDSVSAERLVGQTGLGAVANSVAVYGSIRGGQSAPADTYSDTVPITIYY
jgi:spore coat protein U-like protein